MGRHAPILGLAIACAAATAFACNALSGIGDLVVGGDAGEALDAGIADHAVVPSDAPVTPPIAEASADDGVGDATPADDAPAAVTCESAGGSCTPLPPDGWDGPFLVYDSAPDGDLPDCPATLENTVVVGIGTPSQSFACGACKCGGVSGASCGATIASYSDSAACTDATLLGTLPLTGSCTANTTGVAVGAKISVAVTATGSCTPFVNGAPQRGNLTWTSLKRLCGSDNLTAIGCTSSTDRCLPPPTNAKRCISNNAAKSCVAPYTVPTPAFYDVSDTRSCSAMGCSCDPPTITCAGQYKLYANATCAGFPSASESVNTCFALNDQTGVKVQGTISPNNNGCTPQGTASQSGAFGPGNGTLVCCLP